MPCPRRRRRSTPDSLNRTVVSPKEWSNRKYATDGLARQIFQEWPGTHVRRRGATCSRMTTATRLSRQRRSSSGTAGIPNQMMSKANIHKSVHNRHENGPRRSLRGPFPLVALGRFSPNTLLTYVQDDADVTDRPSRFASPPPKRRRITAQLRAAVVEAYESGQTSRQAAEELALGRTTVLKILKAAGVAVRPQGQKY